MCCSRRRRISSRDPAATESLFRPCSLSRCITCCARNHEPRNHETAKPRNHETAKARNHEHRSSRTRVRRAACKAGRPRTVETDGGRNRIRLLAVTSVVRVDRSSAAPRRASNSPHDQRLAPFRPSCLRAFVPSWPACICDRRSNLLTGRSTSRGSCRAGTSPERPRLRARDRGSL